MNGKDLIKLLLANNWKVVRINGSHHMLEHPEKDDTVVVPVHGSKDLKKGTLNRILKDTGLK